MKLTFCFPEGKIKALTFSYDDGTRFDEHLVEIFNRYEMKATFNLNARHYQENLESSGEYLKKLYDKHEIACHGNTHPFFDLMPQMSLAEDVLENRRLLEKLTGRIIPGMAYPYGRYNTEVIRVLRSLGIVYSRTVKSTGKFNLPNDFLEWNPTCHHSENILELADIFLATGIPSLFYIWGHSIEFERRNNWNLIEDFCGKLAKQENVWYATNIQIYSYINAFRCIMVSADARTIYNPSAYSVWLLNENGIPYEIKSGCRQIFE